VVLLQSNQGPGAARNYGLREASCDLVAFLDADDEWFPKHLEVSVGKLFSNDLMLTAHNEMLMENGLESLNDSLARLRECVDPYVALYRKGCISTSTVICKRHAIVEVGGFDADLANGQDVDLWLAVLRQPGARFDIFEEPLSRYIIREGSVNSNISKRFYYFTKIARRWAGEIVVRRDGRMMDLWFRISAIHYEAFKGHSKNAAFIRAFLTCAMYPMNLFDITVRGLLKVTPGRPMSLYQPNPKA